MTIEMDITLIDTVRASREGHHFHEAWAARLALTLLAPKDGLIGIAVEGLSPVDQADADDATAQIADLVLYYGADASFDACDKQVILQLKYSIAKADVQLVASDMAKTLKKFALSEAELLKTHAGTPSAGKRAYRVVSNRPFGRHFLDAINALKTGRKPDSDEVVSQLQQIKKVLKLKAADQIEFAKRLAFTGEEPNLPGLKNAMAIRVSRWSAGNDLETAARLGRLDEIIRAKAESSGQDRNVIRFPDVLQALRLDEVEQLLPTPTAFPQVKGPLTRDQGAQIIARLPTLDRPLLVHATGGMGKTVLMQQLRDAVPAGHEVILFDCFGGGAYRNIWDERHKLNRGLLHIINQLALKGLCDPLLPGQMDDGMTLRAAARRLKDAATTLQDVSPGALLVLLLDGADNAAQQALDRNEQAFPTALLDLAKHGDLPAHVRLVLTCRTERRRLLGKSLHVEHVALQPFTQQETAQYLQRTLPGVRPNDSDIAFAHSGGNPRVLRYLIEHWPAPASSDQALGVIALEQLIQEHIQQASDLNHDPDYLEPFLAGLAVLPMPIPVADYAAAYNITPEEARSLFVALSPLLEETQFGVIFRDEPTETWIRQTYASRKEVLARLADCLRPLQGTSHFAGLALPQLLVVLGDVEGLVKLALSDSPSQAPQENISGRRIKIARARAALSLAIRHSNDDIIVRLLIETGTLQHAAEKGSQYIADYSDLSGTLGDSDILLQLYRYRSGDPLLRHARLTVAHLLAGAPEHAAHHAYHTREWLRARQDNHALDSDPPFADAAVSFHLLHQRDFDGLFTWLTQHSPQYTYSLTVEVLSLARALQDPGLLVEVVAALRSTGTSSPGLLAGVLDKLFELPTDDEAALLDQLAIGVTQTPIKSPLSTYADPLLNGALRAYRLGKFDTSQTLHAACTIQPPEAEAFDHESHGVDLPNWLLHCMLGALLCRRQPSLVDILPAPFKQIAQQLPDPDVESVVARWVPGSSLREQDPEYSAHMINMLRTRMMPMLNMTILCSAILSRPAGLNDEAAAGLIELSKTLRDEPLEDGYRAPSFSDLEHLARTLAFRILRLSHSFSVANAGAFAQALHASRHNELEALEYVTFFANHRPLHEVAGEMTRACVEKIEQKRDLRMRREAFALLARAVLPASRDESHSLYREGLSLIDDVERGDNRFLSRVFAMSQHLDTPTTDTALASRFASLCESGTPNHYGIHFPWLRFGQAAAATLGPRALLLIGRWDSDSYVNLSSTIGPVLVAMLQRNQLDAVQALALLAVEIPGQWKSLQLDGIETRAGKDLGIIDALAARGDLPLSEVCEELTTRIELEWERTKKLPSLLLPALFSAHPKAASIRERLSTLNNAQQATLITYSSPPPHESGDSAADPELERRHKFLTEVVDATDPCDSASIQASWTRLDQDVHLAAQDFFERLRMKVQYAQQANHVQALSEVCAPWTELSGLLQAVYRCLEAWPGTLSLKRIRPTLAARLISANLPALAGEPYTLDDMLSNLAGLGPTPISEIARNLVTVACERNAEVAPATWLALGAALCAGLNPQNMSSIVSRLLDSPIAHRAEHDGVGKHRKWLAAAGDGEECIADLIHLRLGDPDPGRRNAATDAIVFLAKHQRFALLEKLVTLSLRSDGADGHGGQGHFRFMDAHLSLAIGLLRSLQSTYSRSVGPLLSQVLGKRQQHPLLCQIAMQVGEAPAETLVSSGSPWSAPSDPATTLAEVLSEQPTFEPRLAEIFSMPPTEIAARVATTMSQWAPAMATIDANEHPADIAQNFAQHRSHRKQREFMAHLHWHATLIVGGELMNSYQASLQPFDKPAWQLLIREAWEMFEIQWT